MRDAGIQTVAVFGSGKVREGDPVYGRALELGRALAQKGYTVVNGGYRGVMEASARGASQAGGRTVGITTTQFPGTVNPWIREERRSPTWQDRLFGLIEQSDAYVVLDGGTGTLVELFTVWEMANQNLHVKRIIVYGDFFTRLFEFLRTSPYVVFNSQLKVAQSLDEVVGLLAA